MFFFFFVRNFTNVQKCIEIFTVSIMLYCMKHHSHRRFLLANVANSREKPEPNVKSAQDGVSHLREIPSCTDVQNYTNFAEQRKYDHTFPMFNGLHCVSFLRYWHNNESSWAVPSEGIGFVDREASVVLSAYDRPHHSKCPFICVTLVSLFLLVYNGSLICISHYCQANDVECGFLMSRSHPKINFFEHHMYWNLTKLFFFLSFFFFFFAAWKLFF